jgi:uncharacterized protein
MLVQFVVENFLSFKDKQILSMRAPAAGAARIGGAFHEGKQQTVRTGGEEILRCAAIYGANASGKSNLVRALELVQYLILEGTPRNERIPRRYFKLDPACRAQPSRFELAFIHDDELYSYGLAIDGQRVHAEWLYRGTEGDESLMFQRELDASSGQHTFEVGEALTEDPERRMFYEFLHQGTRPHQLFLHEATERNTPELDPPLTWFRERLGVIYPDNNFLDLHSSIDTDPAFREFLTDLLAQVDTGIQRIDARRIALSALDESIQAKARDMLQRRGSYLTPGGEILRLDEHGDIEAIKLIISHGNDTNTARFSLDEESDGTQRLMHLAYALRGDEQSHPPCSSSTSSIAACIRSSPGSSSRSSCARATRRRPISSSAPRTTPTCWT